MNTASSKNYFMLGFERAVLRTKARQAKEQAEQQEVQTVQEELQQQLLAIADLKARIKIFRNADIGAANSAVRTTSNTSNNTDKISDEQYQASIIKKMINLIHNKRKTA